MRSRHRRRFGLFLTWLAAAALIALSTVAQAQRRKAPVVLSSPLERQVFQRGEEDVGQIAVAGLLPAGAEQVEARTILAAGARRGQPVDWTTIADAKATGANRAGRFQGVLTAPAGGWYRLEVRARKGDAIVMDAAVERVGVGDVFVTAGQSNSANFGQTKQAAKDDRVVYFDGRSYVPARDPIPGGFGGGGTPWPLLGGLLAKQWNLPIAFRSATLTYTPVAAWLPGTGSQQYATLVARIKQFGPRGVRAVLWHHGESDSLAKTTAEQYRDRLTQVIQAVRKDVDYPIDWFVAQASFHTACTPADQQPVAAGQRLLWEAKTALAGPVTDDLLGKEHRHDGVHFTVKGLQVHAQRWAEAITQQYGK